MSNILLAIPRQHSLDALYPPVGLLYLAAAARNAGHEVTVVDGQIDGDDKILQVLQEGTFHYFGTTILTPLRNFSYDLIKKVRGVDSRCVIIAGGPHVSILPEQTLRHVPEIDIAVLGEGEATLVEILSGKSLGDIPGICYRAGDRVVKNKRAGMIDPAKLPMPAWDLIDICRYRSFEEVVVDGQVLGPMLTIYSSRGCAGACSFCSTWWVWNCWRQLPSEHFFREIKYLYDRGIDHFFIADDSMIGNEAFVVELAEAVAGAGLALHLKVACRADMVTETVARALKQAGCYEVHVGFESGSQKILDAVGKKITVQQNIDAALTLKRAGLKVYALMVVGSLEEDIDSINETIDFLKIINPDVLCSMGGLMLLPGTRDYEKAKKLGVVDDGYWLGSGQYPVYTGKYSSRQLRYIMGKIQRREKVRNNLEIWIGAQLVYYRKRLAQLGKKIGWTR